MDFFRALSSSALLFLVPATSLRIPVHFLYFYSDFLRDPFQATPLRSSDCHLFSATTAYKELAIHSRFVGMIGTAFSAYVHHAESHTPMSSSGGSTVSFATVDTTLQTDLASFRDSVQSSLDQIQAQLQEVTTMTRDLESNFQIGLNNRFGIMSSQMMEFQSEIGKKWKLSFPCFVRIS